MQHIRTFIVHGRDEATKSDLKNYLQNALKLPEPLVLHEQPSMARTIIEKFEDVAQQVNLVFVLLTPDDYPQGSEESNEAKRRARQKFNFRNGIFLR